MLSKIKQWAISLFVHYVRSLPFRGNLQKVVYTLENCSEKYSRFFTYTAYVAPFRFLERGNTVNLAFTRSEIDRAIARVRDKFTNLLEVIEEPGKIISFNVEHSSVTYSWTVLTGWMGYRFTAVFTEHELEVAAARAAKAPVLSQIKKPSRINKFLLDVLRANDICVWFPEYD